MADLEAREGLRGPVLVVGAGLLGTSLGLALRARGVEVFLRDVNSEHLRTATGLGAGIAGSGSHEPQLVVVAVPPDLLSDQIRAALDEFPAAIVTVARATARRRDSGFPPTSTMWTAPDSSTCERLGVGSVTAASY